MQSKAVQNLIEILKNFSLKEVLEIEERFDEQFKALKYLYDNLISKNHFCVLVLLNALISYQLSGTGEQYWWEFSKYFAQVKEISNPVDALVDFLRNSKFNMRLINQKVSRLRKLRYIINIIYNESSYYANAPVLLQHKIAKTLNTSADAKTVVFAIKMFNYACRIMFNRDYILPFEISIPVDIRIRRISERLGVSINIVGFWNEIAKIVNIPPLHLDSLLWITLGLIRRKTEIKNSKLNRLARFLKKLVFNAE